MAEGEAEVLKVGDYLVIVVYFVFVLLVGLWVSCDKYLYIFTTTKYRHHGDQRGTVLGDTF